MQICQIAYAKVPDFRAQSAISLRSKSAQTLGVPVRAAGHGSDWAEMQRPQFVDRNFWTLNLLPQIRLRGLK